MLALILLACGGRHPVDSGGRFDPLAAAGCEAHFSLDLGRDGEPEELWTSTYGPTGGELERLLDLDADGGPDEAWTWTRDEQGQPLSWSVDADMDGAVDASLHYTWVEGRLTETGTDTNADGVIDQLETRTYDAEARLMLLETDFQADGRPEEVCTYTWAQASEPGSAWIAEAPCEAEGRVVNVRTLQLDEALRVTRERRDINEGDLVEDSRQAWNSEGLISGGSYTLSRRGEQSDAWVETYWYSPEGLLLAVVRSWSVADGGSSDLEEETSVSWSCP